MSVSLFGESLGTRNTGASIRDEAERLLQDHDTVDIDFCGVKSVSHSCADEAFAKLVTGLGLRTAKTRLRFVNMREEVEAILRFAIDERLHLEGTNGQKTLCAASG